MTRYWMQSCITCYAPPFRRVKAEWEWLCKQSLPCLLAFGLTSKSPGIQIEDQSPEFYEMNGRDRRPPDSKGT